MTADAANPLTLRFASLAEHIIETVRETDYQHTSVIDPEKGVYRCDCNGFAAFILECEAPKHYARIPKEADQARPRAFEYYEFFSSLSRAPQAGWEKIERLKDARRGDLVAWRFPQVRLGHDTGHVLLVAEEPAPDAGVFRVALYDSAAQAHFDDTRGPGEGRFATGVGSGVIHFETDHDGRPTAFQFAPGDKYVTLPIAIGRAVPFSDEDRT